ncbi:flavin-dependent oxidoreductase [Saccharopolyspora indica]|uniref:flavin-dependent oxidoreductase n=1 Tax=Saccharopolyspora indica TaxID=1229659 RepID=UPI0022EA83F2|nr:flavin-dependent oxidoreductase [Saccharopolyspora indica]MDA3647853.1 flavin-dependent oxidoreductase [Saccharopolyspora indica]
MKVIIVGAGIGGLTTALRLHREGIDCVVHEQSEQTTELGVGINALPHAVKELAALGLLDPLDEVGIRTRELRYAHRLGPVILRKPCGLDAGFAFPQFCLHRGRLQGVLLRAVRARLGAEAVRTGHRLTGFAQDADGVRARFADRRGGEPVTEHGDVLVAADGIHSTVRSVLFPAEGPPRWNGVMMWRGATDWPEFDGGRSMIVAGGTAAKLVVYPIAEGRSIGTKLTNWAICIQTGRPGDPPPKRQDWAKPGDRAELARHIGRFRSPAVDHAGLVEATEEVFEFPMCDRDPLPSWSHGRVTLLGDAAHPMYPMGSNGAGQAILDATSLGRHLAQCADPVEALLAYQDDRLATTSEVVLRNRRGGPENVIDEVERLAPNGFSDIDDVIEPAELEAIIASYAQVTGASQQQVNDPPRSEA